ncbi:MAG: agmatine deiminase family protein [Candidatus Sumerlaeia bacterium]|nr:agmatine deiminase family protein [Candidatus Sumerlaeia bacterium]
MTSSQNLDQPGRHGYRMPAEWEPHKATWLSWPHKLESWPGKFAPVPAVWAAMIREIAEGETVNLLVRDGEMEKQARAVLKEHRADAGSVVFHHIPTNDAWIRDYGPIFVINENADQRVVALKWGYNSWGDKYPPYDLDNAVPARAAEIAGVPLVDGRMILEGGSIDVNGAGLLLTTKACLLNPNRNPELSQEEIERRLKDYLGVKKILWLGDGIIGDDTDGHVDDLTRFVDQNTIVTVVEENKRDENFAPLRENLEELHGMTNLDGGRFDVIELPMPDPVDFEGDRLPASYANFYITNAAVLVPTYDCPKKDEAAVGILGELFPHRRVVGIRSTDLVLGLGSFHCVSQQQPV